VKAYLIAI